MLRPKIAELNNNERYSLPTANVKAKMIMNAMFFTFYKSRYKCARDVLQTV